MKAKKTSVRKNAVPKTRNSSTMTESAFWSFIRSCLRQKSRYWKPIQEAKKLARRKSQSSNKKLKFEYQCAECKGWFADKEIAVDHRIPAGALNKADDLPEFVERLFSEVDNLQILCEAKCHPAKTIIDRENIKISKQNNLNLETNEN